MSLDDDGDPDNEWNEYKRYGLDLVQHQKTQGAYVEIRLGAGSETVVRDFHFGSDAEAQQFVRALEACKTLEAERTQRQIKSYQQELQASASKSNKKGFNAAASEPANVTRGDPKASDTLAGDRIQLLIEIVSGVNVPVGDLLTSDPYVIVRMGNREVHRTEYIPQT